MIGIPYISDEISEPFMKKYEINGQTLVSYCLTPKRAADHRKMEITSKGILINGLTLKQIYELDIKEQLDEFEQIKHNLKVENIKPEPYQVRIYKYDTKTHKSTLVDEVYKGNRYHIDNILPERQINIIEFAFYNGVNDPMLALLYEVNSKYYKINCNFKKFDNGEVYYIATLEEYR